MMTGQMPEDYLGSSEPLPVFSRITALMLLLPAEVLLLTILFDAKSAIGPGILGSISDHVSALPQLLAVTITATLIFGGNRLSEQWSSLSGVVAGHHRWRTGLLVHILLTACFTALCYRVLGANRAAPPALFIIWLLAAAACLISWFSALVHPRDWTGVASRLMGPLTIGLVAGTCGWVGGRWALTYWRPLAFVTFRSVRMVLECCGLNVVHNAEKFTIGTDGFVVQVAPQCSGYEGMGLAIVFVSTYLWFRRDEHVFPQSLLLIPFSIVLMFLANVLRISGLIFLGHIGWKEFAVGGFHSQAGWLAFNVVVLGVISVARTRTWLCRPAAAEYIRTPMKSVPLLTPFVVLTLTIMITRAIVPGFDWFYFLRVISVLAALWLFRKRYSAATWLWPRDLFAPTVGFLVYLLWTGLEFLSGRMQISTMPDELRNAGPLLMTSWLILRVVGSVITVPIAEEMAFRGYLLPWLMDSKQTGGRIGWGALLVSSAAFGVLHPGRWIAGSLAGGLYGIAYLRRGKLMDAMIAHACTNALIAVHVLVTGHWNLWN